MDKNSTIEVRIEVPVSSIKITNLKVTHEKESKDCPASTDITYDCITIDGLPDDFEIIDYDDGEVDKLGEHRWDAGETE